MSVPHGYMSELRSFRNETLLFMYTSLSNPLCRPRYPLNKYLAPLLSYCKMQTASQRCRIRASALTINLQDHNIVLDPFATHTASAVTSKSEKASGLAGHFAKTVTSTATVSSIWKTERLLYSAPLVKTIQYKQRHEGHPVYPRKCNTRRPQIKGTHVLANVHVSIVLVGKQTRESLARQTTLVKTSRKDRFSGCRFTSRTWMEVCAGRTRTWNSQVLGRCTANIVW
jgi:hypothetical protein